MIRAKRLHMRANCCCCCSLLSISSAFPKEGRRTSGLLETESHAHTQETPIGRPEKVIALASGHHRHQRIIMIIFHRVSYIAWSCKYETDELDDRRTTLAYRGGCFMWLQRSIILGMHNSPHPLYTQTPRQTHPQWKLMKSVICVSSIAVR
uniref:Putative secreted protein n=1 Tax=Anopheles triannulatus TaxID=58253 RepID=A0A2M4B320_9DIPT